VAVPAAAEDLEFSPRETLIGWPYFCFPISQDNTESSSALK